MSNSKVSQAHNFSFLTYRRCETCPGLHIWEMLMKLRFTYSMTIARSRKVLSIIIRLINHQYQGYCYVNWAWVKYPKSSRINQKRQPRRQKRFDWLSISAVLCLCGLGDKGTISQNWITAIAGSQQIDQMEDRWSHSQWKAAWHLWERDKRGRNLCRHLWSVCIEPVSHCLV